MRIVLITGISGSGKSVALTALEDGGYYCVDNLPPRFLPDLVSFLTNDGRTLLAVAIDARSGMGLIDMPGILTRLREAGHDVRVLFLNASTQALIARFSETRRRHPLSSVNPEGPDASLADAIEGERELLSSLAELGHQIDTSSLRSNTLRAWVKRFAEHDNDHLTLMFESFGFKRGLPLDADFVFDVRSLPNPFYDHQLRALTGLDEPVKRFLGQVPAAAEMISDIHAYLEKWLPTFRDDNRSYLTVAIGCTGGQHRSVYIAQALAARFGGEAQVIVRHRDMVPAPLPASAPVSAPVSAPIADA
ncbi:RNase adapter RapZ [Chitinasiproducens palmae]|uniref:UPF0042 nucleotide-binding protein n=1 Tax=Chitinasiproducens palmae TaxID=1770053 RepID=A0A1H2PNE8_9BURK|nr:RNase adapter RapZ [Chitinasiproducens palmae]SDV48209.1 UPF0042 nucleotide-binding protein [Chitinasiproducens palmae]